jgi:hypothetical protein
MSTRKIKTILMTASKIKLEPNSENQRVNLPSSNLNPLEGVKPPRCYYIDWLRVLTMLMIFLFHNAHLFDYIDWHLKNKQQSFWATAFVAFVHFWSMPLLFLLAGASTWFARNYKTGSEYIRERFKRLIIPFIFGLFIIIPPQIYIEGLSKSRFTGSFFHNYPRLFAKDALTCDPQAFSNYGHHLWFLAFLFIFSLLDLLISRLLRTGTGPRFIAGSAVFLEKKGLIFLSVIPITLIQILLRVKFPAYCSWADFWYWFVFFIYGFLIMSERRLLKAVVKQGLSGLFIGISCLMVIGYFYLDGNMARWIIHPRFSLVYILFMFVYTFAAWGWVVFILSLGIRLLNFGNRFLKYAQEAILPFYILHQTIILLVGFYVIQWRMTPILKFLIISAGSFIGSVGLYELFIRRFNFIRFWFGLKPIKLPLKRCEKANFL